MTVRDNIRAKMTKIQEELSNSGGTTSQTATELQDKAVKAILGGASEWVDYMRLFALPDHPEQLARLIPTEENVSDTARQKARAYLLANGTCGAGTTTRLDENVTNLLNEG
jgi:hypothetical protein